jgi:transcriptional antiterminator
MINFVHSYDSIYKQCKKDELSIYQVTGKGIEIKGTEFKKRKVLVCRNQKVPAAYYDQMDEVPDLRMEKENYSRTVSQYLKSTVDGVIDCIQRLEKEIGYQFNDYTFCMIAEYAVCQITRIKRGWYLEETMINRLTLVESIADLTDRFVRLLNRKFTMNIDPREGLYLYILLLGAEIQNSSSIVNKKVLIEKEISIEDVTKQVITYLSAIIGLDFSTDTLLNTSLALFLNSSLVRVKYGFEIKNPFLEEVKKTYSAIFSACLTASKEYEELVDVLPTEDEISYMAILFGGAMVEKKKNINTAIIGSGGIGITQIVAQKIETRLPQINIINLLPANQELFIKENQYDLVITIIPTLKIKHPNVVYTTLLVNDQDIYRIKKACGILLEQGYVKKGFFESVMHREEISSSVLGGGMAVPHGVSEYVEHPAVVVIRSDDSIEWGEGAVDVIFLLALNFEDIESTRAFFAAFYEMTMQKESGYMQEDGS